MATRAYLLAIITSLCFAAPTLRANEIEVCDGQIGAAYGLCLGYYDALHCDEETGIPSKPCAKIDDKYLAITGVDIRSLMCPCFGASDIEDVLDICEDKGQAVICVGPDENVASNSIGCDLGGGTMGDSASSNTLSFQGGVCTLIFLPYWDEDDVLFNYTSDAQKAACLALIHQKQDEPGVCPE